MNYTSDIRKRITSKKVGENVTIDYEVTNNSGQPVHDIDGKISKDAQRIGRLNVDVTGNSAYISLEKVGALTHPERKAVLSAISEHIEEILTAPVEEQA